MIYIIAQHSFFFLYKTQAELQLSDHGIVRHWPTLYFELGLWPDLTKQQMLRTGVTITFEYNWQVFHDTDLRDLNSIEAACAEQCQRT